MIRQRRLSVLALMALPVIAGCTGVLVWASKKDASWQYIRQNCHGMAIGPASVTQTELSFPIDVHDVVNSSMCIYDARKSSPRSPIPGSSLRREFADADSGRPPAPAPTRRRPAR
jgi:hypothetical protein